MKELHVIVQGKVQGVWFRAWTRDTAREMEVKGWVRNLPDGNVEAVAQAEESMLQRFLERLHEGPPLARVTEIGTEWREPGELFTHFDINR